MKALVFVVIFAACLHGSMSIIPERLTEVDFLLPKGTFPHAEFKDYFAAIRNGEVIFFHLNGQKDVLPPRPGLMLSDFFPGVSNTVKFGYCDFAGNITFAINTNLAKVYKWSEEDGKFWLADVIKRNIFGYEFQVQGSNGPMNLTLDMVAGIVDIDPRTVDSFGYMNEEFFSVFRLPDNKMVVVYWFRRVESGEVGRWRPTLKPIRDVAPVGLVTSAVFDDKSQKYFTVVDRKKFLFLTENELKSFSDIQLVPSTALFKMLEDELPIRPPPPPAKEPRTVPPFARSPKKGEKPIWPFVGGVIALVAVLGIVLMYSCRGNKKSSTTTRETRNGGRSELMAGSSAL